MELLQYEVNGIKYLLFEVDVNSRSADELDCKIELYNGIIQSAVKTSGFWDETIVRVKVLIPEKFAIFFSNKTEL